MKKILTLIAIAALAFGCQKDSAPNTGGKTGVKYTIQAVFDGERTILGADGKSVDWATDDLITVVPISGGAFNIAGETLFESADPAAGTFSSDNPLAVGDHLAFYGNVTAGASAYTFSLDDIQVQSESGNADHLADYDFLVSAVKTVTTAETTPRFSFKHAFTVLKFVITAENATDADYLESITVTDADGASFRTLASVAPDGTIAYSVPTDNVALMLDDNTGTGFQLADASDVQQTYTGYLVVYRDPAATGSLTITASTSAGDIELDATADGKAFAAGKMYTVTRTMDVDDAVGVIPNGDYVVIGANTAKTSYYALAGTVSSSDRLLPVDYDYQGETSIQTANDAIVWTITKTSGGYTMKNGNNFISHSSGSTADLSTTAYDVIITRSGTAGGTYYNIQPPTDNTRYLLKNNSAAHWAFYAQTIGNKDLLLIPASVLPLPVISVADPTTLALANTAAATASTGEVTFKNSSATDVTITKFEGTTDQNTVCTWITSVTYNSLTKKYDVVAAENTGTDARSARIFLTVNTTVDGNPESDEAIITVEQSAAGASWVSETFANYNPSSPSAYGKNGSFNGITTGTPSWSYTNCGNTTISASDKNGLPNGTVVGANSKYITLGKSGTVSVTITSGITDLKFNAVTSSSAIGTLTVTANGSVVKTQSIAKSSNKAFTVSDIDCGGFPAVITFTVDNNRLTIGDISWIAAD